MGAFEDFVAAVRNTDAMKALFQGLEEGPVKLMGSICKEYEATNKLVPDHHLNLTGYFGEAILRALTSANLLVKEQGVFSLYGYKPTERGLELYRGMLEEKKI